MKNTTIGAMIAARLSEKAEATIRNYSDRTGIEYEALIQSALMRQIESISEDQIFNAIQVIRSAPLPEREVRLEIHPMVAEYLNDAAEILGVDPDRLAGICLKSESSARKSDLMDMAEFQRGEGLDSQIRESNSSANDAAELQLALSKEKVLCRDALRSCWLENWTLEDNQEAVSTEGATR